MTTEKEKGSSRRKALLFSVIAMAVGLVLALIVARLADQLVFMHMASAGSIGDEPVSGGIDPRRSHITVNTLDLYPWTGGHTQAHFSLFNGKLQSGDHGFFVDFNLDQPPPKRPGEIRVILIGGSAAAGWGAYTNEDMLYRQLERRWRETRPCGERTPMVINLAMGNALTHMNFNALNFWGHALAPDLILSFSGVNDMQFKHQTLVYPFFYSVQSYVLTTRPESNTWLERAVAFVLPHAMEKTALGMALRALHVDRYKHQTERDFNARFPNSGDTYAERTETVAVRW